MGPCQARFVVLLKFNPILPEQLTTTTQTKVAIYAPGLDASFADDAIDGLRLCWPVLREFMTFHLGKLAQQFVRIKLGWQVV